MNPVANPCERGHHEANPKERHSAAFEDNQSDSRTSSMRFGLLWGLVTIGLAPP